MLLSDCCCPLVQEKEPFLAEMFASNLVGGLTRGLGTLGIVSSYALPSPSQLTPSQVARKSAQSPPK